MMHVPFYTLMLVTQKQQSSLKDYLDFIDSCVHQGVTSVQLREKNTRPDDLLTFGQALKNKLTPLHIPLIVNDNLELAIALDAAGVHLGQTDGDPLEARQRLGAHKTIGVSIDSYDNLIKANALPIDYVGVGAIFPTPNKKNVSTVWGLDGLQQLVPHAKHPVVAIGGIDTHNVTNTLMAGAHGIAVIGALHNARDPGQTAQELRRLMTIKQTSNGK